MVIVMNIQEKLKIIKKLSSLTQENLAGAFGVSFVTLNSWINGRSQPRANSANKIDELYRKYTGQRVIPSGTLIAKKQIIKAKSEAHKNILKEILGNSDVYDEFVLSLTYNTNSIEGSTLTERETAEVLFHDVALPNKSLIEQMEAKNHLAALDYLFNSLNKSQKINENFILKLHAILMNGIISNAGMYRRHAVRIAGSNVPTANYMKVPDLMAEFSKNLTKNTKDTVANITAMHSKFEQIHPFSDGNGRVGRLLMHAMALSLNLPPIVILQEKKQFYYTYLNKAQLEEKILQLEDFVCDALLNGFDVLDRKISE